MTTSNSTGSEETCPVQALLKQLSGKWKPEIFRLAVDKPVRFNQLLKQLPGSNKQSVSVALKELEDTGLLKKEIIQQKPLHIEYSLTANALSLIPIFEQLGEWERSNSK